MSYSRWPALVWLVLLAGCVPLQSGQKPHAKVAPTSTVLFSVTLTSAAVLDREPTGLIVDVADQHATLVKQFAFTPNSRIPGHHTTFLVRLDLPVGAYGVTRLTGIAADGAPIPQFDVAPTMTFNLRQRRVDYIGHVELTNPVSVARSMPGSTRFVIADAYEDELPNFVHAWPSLRGRLIGRGTVAGVAELPVAQGARAETAATPTMRPAVEPVGRLDSSAAAGLPPNAQRAFRNFLRGGYPRAFAVAASGDYTGMALGGVDVIARALQDCRRAQPAEHRRRCRLFALDDTLLSSFSGAATKRPSAVDQQSE